MTKHSWLLLPFILTSMALAEPPSVALSTTGVTLSQCYRRARQINETIGISAENTRLFQAQYRTEVGAILPHVDWIKSQFYQERATGNNGSSGGNNSSLLTVQPLSYFQLTQPIFAGGRDWQLVKILKSQERQAFLAEKATDLQLLSDVAAAFYAAYTLQDALTVLDQTRKLNQEQVDQLSHFVNVGRSRSSEILSAQTQLATIDAQIANTRRLNAQARHLLLFLTGVPPEVPLKDDPREGAPGAASVEEALNRSAKRPELLSGDEALHQAELAIAFARGGHLPTLGVTGRYYTERVGFLSDVHWDATFLLDVPIYAGGSTQAQVQAARSQELIAQLTYARLKRDVERQVRTAYDDASLSSAEVQAYEKAVELAQKDFEVEKKEFRQGVINNLELLQLLTNMQNIRGQWLLSRANARLNDIRLRVAMGEGDL